MKPFSLFIGFSALALTTACGLGGKADVGDDRSNSNLGGEGGGAGTAGAAGEGTAGAAGAGTAGSAGSGNPGCTSIAQCVEGFVWSDAECACVPDGGGGGCTSIALCVEGYIWSEAECACVPDGGGCTTMAFCADGFVWSEATCSCVPAGVQCGPTTCAAGQVCCNESCGICTEPGGVCTQQFCEPPPVECTTDANCFLVEDYCTGCDCRALSPAETLPVCNQEPVQCFANPCDLMQAACVDGQCVAVTAATL